MDERRNKKRETQSTERIAVYCKHWHSHALGPPSLPPSFLEIVHSSHRHTALCLCVNKSADSLALVCWHENTEWLHKRKEPYSLNPSGAHLSSKHIVKVMSPFSKSLFPARSCLPSSCFCICFPHASVVYVISFIGFKNFYFLIIHNICSAVPGWAFPVQVAHFLCNHYSIIIVSLFLDLILARNQKLLFPTIAP